MFASAGKTLHIHSLERGGLKTISKFSPKSNVNIKQISWCHDNSYIAILPEKENPQILSTKDPGEIILVHTITVVPEVTALKFKTNTKRLIALGTRRGEVMLYDTKNRSIVKVLEQLSSPITALEFNGANELAVITGNNLVIFNLTDTVKTEYPSTEICTTLKCLNRNSGQIVVGGENGKITVWDLAAKKELKTYHLHAAGITGIAFSNKDKLMVSTGMDNKICVIDNATQKCTFKKILHQPITSTDISANEQHMIAGLKDGSIYVYQMSDHLKPQICSRMHPCSINQISFVNGFILELLESDSIVDEENECEVESIDTKERDITIDTIFGQTSSEEIDADFKKDQQEALVMAVESIEIPEEKVKSDLIKIINGHFKHLEEQLADHCGKLQELVSSELDSLYAVAARWECFKTMEMEEIVRYICGVVSAPSETRILSQKSEHTNMKLE